MPSTPFFTTRVGVSMVDYAPPGRSNDEGLEELRSQYKDRYGPGTASVAKYRAQKHKSSNDRKDRGVSLQEEVRELRDRLEEAESELQGLRKSLSDARKTEIHKNSEIACLQAEVKSLKLHVESRDGQIEGQDMEVKNLKERMEKAFEHHDHQLRQGSSKVDAGAERHRALLLNTLGQYAANASFEMVRVCWSAWYKSQEATRTDKYKREIAKARKAARMAKTPAHIKSLERWTASNDDFMAQMYFREWSAWLREEKEVARIANQRLADDERSKAQAREEVARQQQAEKHLHHVRAAILRMSNGQDEVWLRSYWSSWREFAETERRDKKLQNLSFQHAQEKRQASLKAFMMMISVKGKDDLRGIIAGWRQHIIVSRKERDDFLEQQRLAEVREQRLDQTRRRASLMISTEGGRLQLLTLWKSWRDYVQISLKERIVDMERRHKENLRKAHVKRAALCVDLFALGETRALQMMWSAWQEVMRERYLTRERERERREVMRLHEEALEAQRKLRIEYFTRLAFAREQQNDPLLLRTVCSHWYEIVQHRKREDTAKKETYLEALEKTDEATIQKVQEIRGSRMESEMSVLLGVWDDNLLLQRCWFAWKTAFMDGRENLHRVPTRYFNDADEDVALTTCQRLRRCLCQFVCSLVMAVTLSTAVALVLARFHVVSADVWPLKEEWGPLKEEWESLDFVTAIETDILLALFLSLVFVGHCTFGLCVVLMRRRARRQSGDQEKRKLLQSRPENSKLREVAHVSGESTHVSAPKMEDVPDDSPEKVSAAIKIQYIFRRWKHHERRKETKAQSQTQGSLSRSGTQAAVDDVMSSRNKTLAAALLSTSLNIAVLVMIILGIGKAGDACNSKPISWDTYFIVNAVLVAFMFFMALLVITATAMMFNQTLVRGSIHMGQEGREIEALRELDKGVAQQQRGERLMVTVGCGSCLAVVVGLSWFIVGIFLYVNSEEDACDDAKQWWIRIIGLLAVLKILLCCSPKNKSKQ